MIKNFKDVLKFASERGPKKIAVACANDTEVLQAVDMARKNKIAEAILVGDREIMEEISKRQNISLDNYEIVDIKDMTEASRYAVELVSTKKADILMKGLVDTSILLRATLDKEIGLRTGSVLSHVAVFSLESYHKMLFVTDAAMNIAPDLETKKKLINNVLVLTKALDIKNPNVAVVCANEKVNDKMPCTLEAAELSKMSENGEFPDCVVSGPFALDNAISKEAAEIKGVKHKGKGDADVILCPNIESGNILYKSLSFLAKADNAGIILGASAPIVLTSRADSDETKLYSIALSVLMASSK